MPIFIVGFGAWQLPFFRMDERILDLYERTQRLMNQAALCVDIDEIIDALYNFLRRMHIFWRTMTMFLFFTTPLHIAAFDNNIPLAMEMMRLKPSFARKLDSNGWSPMHLALEKRNTEMVRQLLQVNSELVHIKGKKCVPPLHYAAKREEHLDLLAKFLRACPDSIANIMVQNDTALHIALKFDNFKAFKLLVGWLGSNWSEKAYAYEMKILK